MNSSPDLVDEAMSADEEVGPRRGTSLLSPLTALALAGALFAVAQLLLFDEGRYFEWDEAVYASRASDRFAPVTWSAHRALGVPWILTPILWLTDSIVAIRLWLVATSTVSLTLAFAAWTRTAGYGAVVGFVIFCSNWMVWLYASEASPNLYIAACAVGLVGLIMAARSCGTITQMSRVGIVLAVAAAALLRPSDGIVLAVSACGLSFVVLARQRAQVVLICVMSGIAIGTIAWILEASTFGGPFERWQQASQVVDSGLRLQLGQHVRLLDGPLVGPDRGGVAFAIVAVQVLPACIAGLSIALRRSIPVIAPLAVAAILAAPYIFYVGALAPRFLLPSFALVAVAAGVGFQQIAESGARRLTSLIAGLVVLGTGLALVHVDRIEDDQRLARQPYAAIGHDLSELVGEQSCFVLSQYGYPQFSVASGCRGQRLDAATASCSAVRSTEDLVFVAWVTALPAELESALPTRPTERADGWKIGEIDASQLRCG